MFRIVNILLVCLLMLSAAAVYDMKYEAELAEEHLVKLEREIEQERQSISLLKAEWSVLSQPGRLQDLVERHAAILQLQPLTSAQFGSLEEVPEKPIVIVPPEGLDGPPAFVGQEARAGAALPVETETVR